MNQDWLFKTSEYICDLRTVGVLLQNGKLLVQCDKNGSEYALPGGHVKIGETTSDGLIREFKEETGADIKCVRLLWTEECFWNWNGTQVHNISFYYLIEVCGEYELPDNLTFTPHRDNNNVEFGWIPIEKLSEIIIYPRFITTEIHRLDHAPRHFVSVE